MNRFRKWLIVKLGGFTESHMLITKDGIYIGTNENGIKVGDLKGDKNE